MCSGHRLFTVTHSSGSLLIILLSASCCVRLSVISALLALELSLSTQHVIWVASPTLRLLFHQRRPSGTDMLTDAALAIVRMPGWPVRHIKPERAVAQISGASSTILISTS